MKTVFSRPSQASLVTVNVRTPTIGDGNPSAKSTAYRGMEPLITTVNSSVIKGDPSREVIYLPNTVITPSFFSEFFKRAGVSHERSEEAIKAIDETEFSPYEIAGIKEALAPFAGLYVFLRSDESTASGVGLWHSEAMPCILSGNGLIRAVEIIKAILKSDFSRDVIAFKRRVGLPMEETPGVFVMPAVGKNTLTGDGMFPPFYTPYHFNVIVNFHDGMHIVVGGIGIGGANDSTAVVSRLERLDSNSFSIAPLFGGLRMNLSGAKVITEDGVVSAIEAGGNVSRDIGIVMTQLGVM
ncbi:MAG: hypothetical protein WCT31_03860, partial [Candidatus Micrarchaeia archaeon]